MNSYLRNTFPTLTVIAMATLCCWPYLVGNDSLVFPDAAKNHKGLLESTGELSNRIQRNPFGVTRSAPVGQPTPQTRTTSVASRNVKATEAAPAPQVSPYLAGLTLQATCISGRERAAMINGEFYETGDELAVSGEVPLRVNFIHENAVVLQDAERTHVLSYSDLSPKKQAQADVEARASAAAENEYSFAEDSTSLAELFFRSVRMSEELRLDRDTTSTQSATSGRRTR